MYKCKYTTNIYLKNEYIFFIKYIYFRYDCISIYLFFINILLTTFIKNLNFVIKYIL